MPFEIRRKSLIAVVLPALTLAGVAFTSCATAAQSAPSATQAAPSATQAAPSATQAAPAKPAPPAEKIIEGTVNVYTWEPADTSRTVDATDINLRKVFEDLGPTATQWYQHVLTLSNPFFEGRAPGSHGNDVAADYIEFWLKHAGLDPAFAATGSDGITPSKGDWASYRQRFSLGGGTPRVTKAKANSAGTELIEDKDFSVLAISGDGAPGPLPVVFAGYAIEDGVDGYTSFGEDDDLTGKAVLFMRYEPLDAAGHSKWSKQRFSNHSGILPKIEALANRGAAALIMVAPPDCVDGKTRLEDVNSSKWGRSRDLPVIQITADAAEKLLNAGASSSKTLKEWRVLADEGKIKTVALEKKAVIDITTELGDGSTPAQNVGGVLRGKGSLANEWVVVGGHFDHVGMGYFGADPRNAGQLHPGADDNASGTAAMLVLADELADYYKSDASPADMRSVLFLAFTAEESGLRGSRYFVEHPTIPADKVTLMLNMDMVGRLRSDDLNVGGTGTAEGLLEVLRPAFERSKLTIRADPTGRGPSDHASFYSASVPVLFMYTGNHDEYHKPGDKGYTVNPAGAAKIVALGKDIVTTLASRKEQLAFKSTSGQRSTDRGYAGVRLGVMPGLVEEDQQASGKMPKGVLVQAVSADTSAARAGIKEGDVMMTWDGEALTDTATMLTKLRSHKPGDVVKIVVWREGKELPIDVTLLASQRREEQRD